MVEIRFLGGLAVHELEPTEFQKLLNRPRLVALLAYLAVRPGFRRRDTLIGLLWPESGQALARARLRKSLFRLRQALGNEAVLNRGAEEVALATSVLRSDVGRFEQALAEGSAEQALTLYAGDLLPGFFLPDAPAWESWLEDERHRLRELALTAALRLVRECEANDRPEDALRWAREACRVSPEDEPAAATLIRLLAQRGDRVGAIRHFDRFARRLEKELDVEPSEELCGLAGTLRQALPGASTVGSVHARDRPSLAILPFNYGGDTRFEYMGTGLAELLATALDGSESLRCVDPGSLLGWIARQRRADEPSLSSDEELCRAVAGKFNASHCVTGRIVEAGGRLQVRASLCSAADPSIALASVCAEDTAEELFPLADRLAASLLVEVAAGTADGPPRRLAHLTTSSLPALKCYLDGEIAFREGHFTIGADAFERATMLDPTFALAHYRLAVASEWVGMHNQAATAASTAVEHSARLSTHDRRLLMAFHAYIGGDAELAGSLYREILDVHPESAEAWLHLARVSLFLDSLRGRPLAGARPALERAAELDPNNIVVLVHLASVAAKQRQPAEVEAISDQVLALLRQGDHMDSVLLVRLQRAHATGDRLEEERLWPELETANDFTLFWAFVLLSVVVEGLAAVGRVLTLMTRSSRPREVRLFGHLALATLETGRGCWSRAREELHAADKLDSRATTVHRGLLTVSPIHDAGRDELLAILDELRQDEGRPAPVSPRQAGPLPLCFTGHLNALDTARSYLIGMIHARLGEWEQALGRAVELEATAGPPSLGTLGRDQARGIRAVVARAQGDDQSALALLESCELTAPMYLYASSILHGRLAERYLRAELLSAQGREAEAIRWYSALGEDSPFGFLYLAPSLVRRAELLERGGELSRALEFRTRSGELRGLRDHDPDSDGRPIATSHDPSGYVACGKETPLASRATAANLTLEEQMKKKSARAIPDFSRKPNRDKSGKLPESAHAPGAIKPKRGPQPSHVLPKAGSSKSGQRGQ